MIDEAYDKTIQALHGNCIGQRRDECGWLWQVLVLEECSRFDLSRVLQPPFVIREQ